MDIYIDEHNEERMMNFEALMISLFGQNKTKKLLKEFYSMREER